LISLLEITDYLYIDFKFLQQSLFKVKVNDDSLLIMRLKKNLFKKNKVNSRFFLGFAQIN
tara:strand:+ start:536 stop:715 length:180 start_codon:yes stop_codon:yes gene_type:complete